MLNWPFGFPMNNFVSGNSFGFMPMFPMSMNYQLPLFNFNMNKSQVPYYMPMFQFPIYSPSPAATIDNNSELNPKQQAQIEAIQKLKYDSADLQAKLGENNNINDYAKFLETNKNYSVNKTIDLPDGGKSYLYKDKSGKQVGSVNKDKDGNVRNVSLNIADSGSISLNDSGADGTIDSRFAMSKNFGVDINDADKKSYKDVVATILKHHDGYEMKADKNDENNTVEHYFHEGEEILTAVKDKDGNILSLFQNDITLKNGEKQKFFYNDSNKNGIIDGEEGIVRFDRDLS